MKRLNLFALSLLSAFLLSVAWPVSGYAITIFIALVPLLLLEEKISLESKSKSGRLVFAYSYLSFFCWNIYTTWWIYNASGGGAAMAILANSLLMAVVFTAFHFVRRRGQYGYLSLFCFWIAFEYLHLNWDLSWPWLNLGNVFSMHPNWVQWYEYTGALGGSLWVLFANVLAFQLFQHYRNAASKAVLRSSAIKFLLMILVPLLLSNLILKSAKEIDFKQKVDVVVVQPNIDPYNEKFNGMSDEDQLKKLLQLASTKVDSTTDYLIAPETAIAGNCWEHRLDKAPQLQLLHNYLKRYPHLNLVIGASTAKVYENGEVVSSTARKFTQEDAYFDSYNTALQLDSSQSIQLYHKSKLVPGVEKIPFPALFKPFEKLAINLGGTTGSLGIQDTRTVFYNKDSSLGIAPVICYESIYGEFVGDYIKNGANLIFIITNDGWWGDTPGYRQHLTFASLRAIETRRYIARSANTGTSAIINPLGEISNQTAYWQEAVFKAEIYPSNTLTFYVRYGDYLGNTAAVISGLLILMLVLSKFLLGRLGVSGI